MHQYFGLLEDILTNGGDHNDRTGVGTLSVFGRQLKFNLRAGFPLMTTKKLAFRWIAEELFWFLKGSTDAQKLKDKGIKIWDEWATEEQCKKFGRKENDLGPIYGHQWRNFNATWESFNSSKNVETWSKLRHKYVRCEYYDNGQDQIKNVIDLLTNTPNSRRIIISGWNPDEVINVALPPCHTLVQFKIEQEDRLSCHLYQRSADVFLGVPYNIASYALLTYMLASVCDLKPGEFTHTFGDVHIYKNHIEQVKLQLSRQPKVLPTLDIDYMADGNIILPNDDHSKVLARLKTLLELGYDNFKLTGYNPDPSIKAEVAV